MTELATILTALSASAFLLIAILDLIANRSYRPFAFRVGGLALAMLILHVVAGFPKPSSRIAFGGTDVSPLAVVGLMFIAVMVGIAATYIFNLNSEFRWRDFARPLVVSPIILLPLIGSIH